MERIKLPRQRLDAQLTATPSADGAKRANMVWYSGAQVKRFNMSAGPHLLTLSMDGGACDLSFLGSGRAPLLNDHNSDGGLSNVLGVIESAFIQNGKGVGTVRFSDRPEVAGIWADVQNGILNSVSVGTEVNRLKETTKEGDNVRSFLATAWRPIECSIVAIPADGDASFMASASEECEAEIEDIELAGRAAPEKEPSMAETLGAGLEARTEINVEQVTLAAQVAERTRALEIHKITTIGKLDAAFAAQHVESGTTVEEFRRLAFEKLAARETPSQQHHATEIVRDERVTLRECAGAEIMHLFDRKNPVDSQNEFKGMGILRLAEELLNRTGKKTRGLSRAEIAELTMHNTADFPGILADSGRKQMLNAYQMANPTYRVWAKPSTTPDFKTMSRLRLSETPSFLVVPEGAQITLGTMTESREQYALLTYGRGASFTRQMLINDDLGAFNDLQMAFGYQAARLENKTVYAILIANAAMSDTVALFHATHNNLGVGVIGNVGLDAAFGAMAVQKGLDGASVLNLTPKYLITPAAKASTAQNALTASGNNLKPSDQNWFAGRLTPIADAELDASSTIVWYLACDPSFAPGVEYCHLAGAEGPQSLRKENDDAILGVQIYNFLDFGAKAVDWRPLYKSSGV